MINPEAQKLRLAILAATNAVRDKMTEIDVATNAMISLAQIPDPPPVVVEPPPVVKPPPIVVPPPVEPPPSSVPVVDRRPFNASRCVLFKEYHESSRYERFQRITIATGVLTFQAFDFASGGASLKLSGTYGLLLNGKEVATSTDGTFKFDPSLLIDGWNFADIRPGNGETPLPHWILRDGTKASFMPACTGSYDLTHGYSEYLSVKLPAKFAPTPRPLTPRQATPFSDALPPSQMHRTNVVPNRGGTIYRPNVFKGAMTTFNMQAYFWQDYVRKLPNLPLLDGPRGVGTIQCPTHIEVDRHGGAYCTDPWRVVRVSTDGTIRTRAGYRHKDVFSRDNSTLELVGDWSAIPVERRGFHEIWGFAFDQESTVIDPNAAPMGGEQPHPGDVRAFVADSQNNRVCLLTFNGKDKDADPKVTEFITGLNDPWDCVCVGKVLYVSERKSHWISMWDKDTGASLGVLIKGAALAVIDTNRFVVRTGPLDSIRFFPCVAPEGLFHQDGWLYFASKAQGQVRKINLATKELKVVCEPKIDDNSNFVKISLSDGTFGPRGAVFTWTWSNANFGLPQAFLPDGKGWGWNSWSSPLSGGRGGQWQALGYASAGGVGQGRFYTGSSEEGLALITKALPTDPVIDQPKYQRGAAAYEAKGYILTHGDDGFGFYGFPLPKGESADMDYYLGNNP